MAQQANNQNNISKQNAQAGQFNQKNQQNVKGKGMDEDLKASRVSDADEQEDADDVNWGGGSDDINSGLKNNGSNRSKKH